MTDFEAVLREWGARKIEAEHPKLAPVDRLKVTVELSHEGSGCETCWIEEGTIAIDYPALAGKWMSEVHVTGDLAGILAELFAIAEEEKRNP